MIRALGFSVTCDRCFKDSHEPKHYGSGSRAQARRAAKGQGWGRRWQPRRRVNGRSERGHFEDLCPECVSKR